VIAEVLDSVAKLPEYVVSSQPDFGNMLLVY
jgi:hypothetical protein